MNKPERFVARFVRLGRRLLLPPGLLLAGVLAAHAFPPAPHYTLHGMVRDQTGQTLVAQGAQIVLLDGTRELGRTPILSGVRLDQNYELKIRLDQNRSGTKLYSDKAVPTQGAFNLAVEIGGATYYPIHVAGNLSAGKGGERVRLDLNLGEDSDGDGLPDVWKQWQLYQAGYLPDEDGNWPIHLITRDGDFDGDGISNWMEFIAGTFAGDASERFALEIKEKTETHTRFEFFAIVGKAYTIEATTDLKTWTRVPFSVGTAGPGAPSWQAGDVSVVSAFTSAGGDSNQFYRLTVR